ncbi:DUF3772 domain-containing protein [Verticiella sediminum]
MPDMSYPTSRRARSGRACCWLAWLLVLCCWLAPVHAQDAPTADVQQSLDAARAQVDKARTALRSDDVTDAELQALREAMQEVQSEAASAVDALDPQLNSVRARLEELGPPSPDTKEAPDIAKQRKELQASHGALDGQLKLARLLVVESEQVASQIAAKRRAGFQAQLGERIAPVFDGEFWAEVREELPGDLVRLESLFASAGLAVRALPAPVLAALTLAALGVVGLRWWLGRALLTLTAHRVPAGRLRRSFRAVAVVALSTGTPVLLLVLIRVLLEREAVAADTAAGVLGGIMAALAFGGYVVGLGQALLSPQRPSWRLPAVPDLLARRARWFPWGLAIVLVAIWLTERVLAAIDANLLTAVLLNAVLAGALSLVMIVALWQGERVRLKARRQPEDERQAAYALPWWLALMMSAAWIVLGLVVVCLLTGYVALASFVAKQLAWTLIVLCSAYLLAVVIDDALHTLAGGREGDAQGVGRRSQAVVMVSGFARVFILLAALAMVAAPFGQGPSELVGRLGLIGRGLTIGAVTLRPVALLHAALVLVLCLVVLGVLKRWLADRFLPTTGMDEGMRGSAATLFGYVGAVVAVALALIAAGIGLERVAWVASALSVGIGFGLQAVVQNFVSGLILLAERPVRVGDWVAIGGVEGDIRRINARATEIQMGDQSTLIVPNSEFITKAVRNVTYTNAIGLVSFKLPLPVQTDPELVREVVLAAFEAHEDVLEAPEPALFIDGLDGRHLVFNASGYVSSPRIAYRTRSALLFAIVKALRERGVSLAAPETEPSPVGAGARRD